MIHDNLCKMKFTLKKNQIKLFISRILILVIITSAVSGCGEIWLTQKAKSVEAGSDLTAFVLAEEGVSVELKSSIEKIKTVGDSEITFIASKNGKSKEYTYMYKITDTTKPVITKIKEVYIPINGNVDLINYIQISDNSNDNLTGSVRYESINSSTVGEYSTTVTVEDSSGNQGSLNLSYNVIVPVSKISIVNPVWNFDIGDLFTPIVKVEPLNATFSEVVWTSSNDTVLSIENNAFNVKAEGNVTVTVTSSDGSISTNYNVVVNKPHDITFKDALFENDIKLKLNLPISSSVSSTDMLSFKDFTIINTISDVAGIRYAKNVSNLTIDSTSSSLLSIKNLDEISYLKRLTSLSIWYYNGPNISFIGQLKSLIELHIVAYSLNSRDKSIICSMQNLRTLEYGGDDFSFLGGCKYLENLDLRISGRNLSPLTKMPNLKSLLVSQSNLTSADLEILKDLSEKGVVVTQSSY